MEARKCDACGKLFEPYDLRFPMKLLDSKGRNTNRREVEFSPTYTDDGDIIPVDLCRSCMGTSLNAAGLAVSFPVGKRART